MLLDPRWQKQLDDILPPPNRGQLHLIQAKAAIEKYGWVQGRYGDTETGFCVMGAIAHVMGVGDYVGYVDGHDALSAILGGPYIDSWNDAPGRTKQEVLAAFDAAIAAAR